MPHNHCGVPVRIIGIEFLTHQRMRGITHSVFELCSNRRNIGKSNVSMNHGDSETNHGHKRLDLYP